MPALVDPEEIAAEEREGLIEVREAQDDEEVHRARRATTPGIANASRIASMLSGASLRRGLPARFSGGSDSASPSTTHTRLTTLSPAATKHGTAPWRPSIAMRESPPPSPGPEDEAEAEGHPDEAHALRALLGLRDVGDVRAGRAEVRRRDAAEDARREEPQDAAAPA